MTTIKKSKLTKKDIETLIKNLNEELKELKNEEEKKQHKPTEDSLGFFLQSAGGFFCCMSVSTAREYYKNNNWFSTEEEVKKERDKRQAIVRVKEYIEENFGVFEPDWEDEDEEKYVFIYNYDNNILNCALNRIYKYYSPIGYLESKEDCDLLIKNCKEDLLLIFK